MDKRRIFDLWTLYTSAPEQTGEGRKRLRDIVEEDIDPSSECDTSQVSFSDYDVSEFYNINKVTEKYVKKFKAISKDYCITFYLVTSLAIKDKNHPKLSQIKKGRKIQLDLAKELHDNAGVPQGKLSKMNALETLVSDWRGM